MRQYEMMYILHPQLSDEDLTAAIEQVGRYITNIGGEITETLKESPWGRRRLAYTVRHNGQDLRDGFYVVLHFGLENTRKAIEIERAMNLNDRVVRYLITKYEAPKPVSEKKQPEDKRAVS